MTVMVLVVGLSSCGASSHLPQAETRDSVVFRDSILYIDVPREGYAVETYDDSSHLETSIAESDAVVRDGKLRHTLTNKPATRLQTKVALSRPATTLRPLQRPDRRK